MEVPSLSGTGTCKNPSEPCGPWTSGPHPGSGRARGRERHADGACLGGNDALRPGRRMTLLRPGATSLAATVARAIVAEVVLGLEVLTARL